MEYNKSLSARIKRRNKQGFIGVGTGHIILKDGTVACYNTTKLLNGNYGDYRDEEQNNKKNDHINDMRRKAKLNYIAREYKVGQDGKLIFVGRKIRCMSKRYSDNRQSIRK